MGLRYNRQGFISREHFLVISDGVGFLPIENLNILEPIHYSPNMSLRKVTNIANLNPTMHTFLCLA